jgi:hypothetical protein
MHNQGPCFLGSVGFVWVQPRYSKVRRYKKTIAVAKLPEMQNTVK